MKKWKKLYNGMNRKKREEAECQRITGCCDMQQCPVQKEVDACFESVEEEHAGE